MSEFRQPALKWIEATRVGFIASDVLKAETSAEVVGVTSRGIFLKFLSRWMVFVSEERFRSPLTVTTREKSGLFNGVRMGDAIQVGGDEMILTEAGMRIRFGRSAIWSAQSPRTPASTNAERRERLIIFASEVMRRKTGVGLSPLLPVLVEMRNYEREPDQELNSIQQAIVDLLAILWSGKVSHLAESLAGLLGAGGGLTPSGDDFIVGVLLSWNRWRDDLWPVFDLQNLNEILIEKAYEKTTTLSANLIECAAQGQADERLINAVDFLMGGNIDNAEKFVDELLGWGSSSGVDVFVGMATALSTALKHPLDLQA